jgi:hypothetical protein
MWNIPDDQVDLDPREDRGALIFAMFRIEK